MSQQLIDYVAEQVKSGVSLDQVRSALVGAGWSQADIDEAMKGTRAVAPATTPSAASSPAPELQSVQAAVSLGAAATPVMPTEMPEEVVSEKKVHHISLSPLILGVVILILIGGGVFLYFMLSSQLAEMTNAKGNAEAALLSASSQIAQLSKANEDFKTQLTTLQKSEADTKQLLSFFLATPQAGAGTSTAPQELQATVKGTLSGGGKLSYVIATEWGFRVTVKNSKAEKVDAALKPLIGSSVEVSGIHLDGTSELTVKTVNGASVE